MQNLYKWRAWKRKKMMMEIFLVMMRMNIRESRTKRKVIMNHPVDRMKCMIG